MIRLDLSSIGFLALISLGHLAGDEVNAATITLSASEDTYISEHFPGPNGMAFDMVIGTQGSSSGFAKNRGLIKFDLSAISADAVINSVSLRLTVNDSSSHGSGPASNFHLHHLMVEWAEKDSTWFTRLAPTTSWGVPGGEPDTDYASASSASTVIDGGGTYTFTSTTGLVADVTLWINAPGSNEGWLVKTEDESVGFTAGRFASSNSGVGGPELVVDYSLPVSLRINSAQVDGRGFCLSFTAQQGKAYVIERREMLDSGAWTAIRHLPPAETTGEVEVCDPVGTSNAFYRVGEE